MSTQQSDWPSSLDSMWQDARRTTALTAIDETHLVDDILVIVASLYTDDPELDQLVRAFLERAKQADQPAWSATARAMWSLALWRRHDEDSALLQLILAELELQEHLRTPRPEIVGGPLPVAAAHNNLGAAYSVIRMFELAVEHLEEAADLSVRHYGPSLRLQVCADLSNLSDLEVRWALHANASSTVGEAVQHARRGEEHARRFLECAQAIGRTDAADYARSLSIGARSVTDPESIRDEDRRFLADVLAAPVWGDDPSRVTMHAILARVCRLTGDEAQCRRHALHAEQLRGLGDYTSTVVAMREAALLEADAAHSRLLIEVMAAEEEAARRRTVTTFRARLALAGQEQRYEEISQERQKLRSALQDALQQEAELIHAATHDPLTGLPNRTLLEQRLARTSRDSAIVGYLDVDDFKHINDTYGHSAGDRVLKWLAAQLRRAAIDADVIARLGGDEFAVLRTSPGTPHQISAWVDGILTTVHDAPDRPYAVTVSLGVCVGAGTEGTAEGLLHAADAQMYHAKRSGKARASIAWESDAPGL